MGQRWTWRNGLDRCGLAAFRLRLQYFDFLLLRGHLLLGSQEIFAESLDVSANVRGFGRRIGLLRGSLAICKAGYHQKET